MMNMTHSIQSNIITLHDAITDSPVYRAATLHFDKQLDALTQWINDIAEQTKSYAEKLKQLNAEAVCLTNKLNPTAFVNDYLLNSNITAMAATYYGDALKTNLSYKLKTVSDLEGNFTRPIQQFAGQHIRDFKDFRDRHRRALKHYEVTLEKYANFNDDHDSALINSAIAQLDEARKAYVELSTEHVLRIIKLRHELEHFLIQQFSTAMTSSKELFDDTQIWNQLDALLFSWTKWLDEDKRTTRSEIRKQQLAQQTLEKECGDIGEIKVQPTKSSKSGYLLVKETDNTSPSSSWIRQWFFVHNGYFGSCKITNPENTASITVDNCLPLRSCLAKHVDMSNRRFRFEVVSMQQSFKSHFVLQAENEQDLTEWLAAFISESLPRSIPTNTETSCKNHRPSSIIIGSYGSNNDPSRPSSPALLIAKPKSTTVLSTPTDIPVTLSTISPSSLGFPNISSLSSSPSGTVHLILSRPHSITAATSSSLRVTCFTASSTPLLLREITKGLPQLETTLDESSDNDKLWGTPRYLVSHDAVDTLFHIQHQHSKSTGDNEYEPAIETPTWQPSSESLLPLDHLIISDHSAYLDCKNQELRRLFYGVSDNETVLESFTASYLKRDYLAAAVNDQRNKKSAHLSLDSGYYHGGCVYITQDTFWFYSKVSFSYVISVVLKLKDIKEIQVNHRSTKMTIDIVDSSDPVSPLIFSLVHDDVTTMVKKLRLLVYNAKLDKPMPLDTNQQRVTTMSTPTPSLSSTTSTDRGSLNDSSCSSIGVSHSEDIPPGLSSRLASSTTTTTMDTAATLITPNSGAIMSTTKELVTCNRKVNSTRLADPDALPDHINKPLEPITCGCEDHLDRCEVQVELPISAKRLYEMMFSDELPGPSTRGGVWHSKTEGIGGRDLRMSRWEYMDTDDHSQQERQMRRVLKYWMPVANPIVRIKEAEVVETQTLLTKDDYLRYVVEIFTKTEALPFADAFVPSVRYCITYINDSQCQLTCCLGVKWMKWIMAKMIVTRAAFSGMSDSINVFVPILKEAANTIQTSVDNGRQLELNLTDGCEHKVEDAVIDTENGHSAALTATTALIENINTMPKPTTSANDKKTNRSRQLSNAQTQLQTQHSISAPATPGLAATLGTTSTLKMKTTQLRELLLNMSCQKTSAMLNTTMGIIQSVDLWTFAAIIIGCSVCAIIAYLATSYGARLDNTPHVVTHAVFLRDLDEGFIKNSLQPPYSESQSYNLFLESRQNGLHYQWYDAGHYRLAQDYDTKREQLGIMRHSILNMFHALNMADTYLLENEYLNWLLDYRQRCRDERKLIQQQTLEYNGSSSHLCDQIARQIGTYF